MLRITTAFAAVRWLGVCLSITFMSCVATAKDKVIVAMDCEYQYNSTQAFEWYHFQWP